MSGEGAEQRPRQCLRALVEAVEVYAWARERHEFPEPPEGSAFELWTAAHSLAEALGQAKQVLGDAD